MPPEMGAHEKGRALAGARTFETIQAERLDGFENNEFPRNLQLRRLAALGLRGSMAAAVASLAWPGGAA